MTESPPSPRPRGRQRGPSKSYELRRSAILNAAVDVLNRRGVRGMTLGDVTAQLDLVPTGVAYYFKTKEDLAAAVFLKAIERFDAMVAESEGHSAPRLASPHFSRITSRSAATSGWAEPSRSPPLTTFEP